MEKKKIVVTLSVISDDNSRNDLKSFIFDDLEQAKDKYAACMQAIYQDSVDNSCQIDFEHTFIFDKYNGFWVFNIIDDKQIMHRYRVSLSLAS